MHLVKQPRYFAAVDEIREPALYPLDNRHLRGGRRSINPDGSPGGGNTSTVNPLGKLPGSVWTVATEPLQVPAGIDADHFACVDAETEILTRRGWLRHDALRAEDEVAGADLDTGLTRWTRVHGIHRYDFDGEMIAVEARGLSMRLTPNHRTIVRRYVGRNRRRGPVEVIRADTLTAQHGIPRAVTWEEDGQEKSIGVDLAALCAWVAAEGWVTREGRVYLCQSATANPGHVVALDALLARVDKPPADRAARVKYRRSLDALRRTVAEREWRGRPSTEVTWALPLGLSQQVVGILSDKQLPAWFGDLPLVEARTALDAFIDGDGHRRADGRCAIFQRDRANLDVLQAMALRCGYNTTLRASAGRWVLYLNPPRPARLRRADGTSLVGLAQYRGVVWCVTTGTGTFIARRNGSVFVTGNSYPTEWPRRLILGWSPSGICTACGEGRRPVTRLEREYGWTRQTIGSGGQRNPGEVIGQQVVNRALATITGYACACTPYTDHPGTGERHRNSGITGKTGGPTLDETTRNRPLGDAERVGPWREYHFDRWTPAPTRPSTVLDPFGGTGTTAHVATALGRIGITVDLSGGYSSKLAASPELYDRRRRKVLGLDPPPKPEPQIAGQLGFFDDEEAV